MISALLLTLALSQQPCTAWHSEAVPPSSIRVRLNSGAIVRVPFALYVARVTSSEWNKVPDELRKAGAVAVKQYAWYRALRPRRSRTGCFDVNASTADQIYRPWKTPPPYIFEAVAQTWNWRVLRHGRLIQTGYRTGAKVGCARDIDGYHLKARSGARCARRGWGFRTILARYFNARVLEDR